MAETPSSDAIAATESPSISAITMTARRRGERSSRAFQTAVRIASRYLGPERGPAYVEATRGDHVTVRLEPGELRVWDFRDEHDGMGS